MGNFWILILFEHKSFKKSQKSFFNLQNLYQLNKIYPSAKIWIYNCTKLSFCSRNGIYVTHTLIYLRRKQAKYFNYFFIFHCELRSILLHVKTAKKRWDPCVFSPL